MIRYLLILLSLVVLSSTKCSSGAAPAPPGATVYITTTGTKYHIDNCRSLKKSKVSITLAEAIAKGYDPCKICHPPVADSVQK
jgi:competence protein ComEC